MFWWLENLKLRNMQFLKFPILNFSHLTPSPPPKGLNNANQSSFHLFFCHFCQNKLFPCNSQKNREWFYTPLLYYIFIYGTKPFTIEYLIWGVNFYLGNSTRFSWQYTSRYVRWMDTQVQYSISIGGRNEKTANFRVIFRPDRRAASVCRSSYVKECESRAVSICTEKREEAHLGVNQESQSRRTHRQLLRFQLTVSHTLQAQVP